MHGVIGDAKQRIRRWCTATSERHLTAPKNAEVQINQEKCLSGNLRHVSNEEHGILIKHLSTIQDFGRLIELPEVSQTFNGITNISALSLQAAHDAALQHIQDNTRRVRRDRSEECKRKLDIKSDKNGANLFKFIRNNLVPATSTMRDPDTGQFVSDICKITRVIQKAWEPVHDRHLENPPEFVNSTTTMEEACSGHMLLMQYLMAPTSTDKCRRGMPIPPPAVMGGNLEN